MTEPLSEQELAMLELEGHWWQRRGSKEQAIRDRLQLTPTEYYRRLNDLLRKEQALAAAPVVVKRLRELQARRASVRELRRAG